MKHTVCNVFSLLILITHSQELLQEDKGHLKYGTVKTHNVGRQSFASISHQDAERLQAWRLGSQKNGGGGVKRSRDRPWITRGGEGPDKLLDFQRYTDFYTTVVSGRESGYHGNGSLIEFDDLVSKLKKDNEMSEQRKEMWDKQASHVSGRVFLMNRLWAAANKGTLPETEISYDPGGGSQYSHHADRIETLLTQGSVIEVGTGTTVAHIASRHPSITAVSLITGTQQNEFVKYVWQTAHKEGLGNLYVGRVDAEEIPALAETLYLDQQVMFGNMVLTKLKSLLGSLLPHEFEELLARLIAIATQTFIIAEKIEGRHLDFFEQNWDSVGELVRKSCQMASLDCSIQAINHGVLRSVGTLQQGWNSEAVVKVVVNRGQRQLPDALCDVLRAHTQCVLEFGKQMPNFTMIFTDDTEMAAPVDVNSVPLDILVKLGATDETYRKILVAGLQLPYTPQTNLRSLVAMGPSITIRTLGEDDVALDPYGEASLVHQQVQQIFGDEKHKTTQEFDKDHHDKIQTTYNKRLTDHVKPTQHIGRVLPKPVGVDPRDMTLWQKNTRHRLSPIIANSIPRSTTATERADNAAKPSNQGHATVANSQVDGVAQQWIRVEGDSPTAVQRDDQQFQSMGKHWDRENIDGLHGSDPLLVQANQELARFDRGWEREQRDGDQDDSHQASLPRTNNDAILRRDEKEVRRAMGFLHGESDLKEMGKMLGRQKMNVANGKAAGRRTANRHKNTISQYLAESRRQSKTLVSINKGGSKGQVKDKDNQKKDTVLRFQKPKNDGALVGPETRPLASLTAPNKVELEQILRDDGGIEKRLNDNKNPALLTDDLSDDTLQVQKYSHLSRDANKGLRGGPLTFVFNPAAETRPEEADYLDINGQHLAVADGRENREEYEEYDQRMALEQNLADTQHVGHIRRWGNGGLRPDRGKPYGVVQQDMNSNPQEVEGRVGGQGNWEEGGEDGWREEDEEDQGEGVKLKEVVIDDAMEGVDQTRRRLLMVESPAMRPRNVKDVYKFKTMQKRYQPNFGSPVTSGISSPVTGPAQKQESIEKSAAEAEQHKSPVVGTTSKELKMSLEGRKAPRPLPSKVEILNKPSTEKTTKGNKVGQGHEDDDGDDMDSTNPDNTPESDQWQAQRFGPPDKEEALYDHLWRHLQPEMLIDRAVLQQPFSVFTYGGRSQSLVGLKLALTYHNANVLSLMPMADQKATDRHRRVMESVGTRRALLLLGDLSPTLVDDLTRSPDMFRYQVLGFEVFQWLLQLKASFTLYLGKLLSMATTTFLQVPDPQMLCLLQTMLAKSQQHGLVPSFKGLVYDALRRVGAESSEVTLLDDTSLPTDRHSTLKVIKVVLHTIQRHVQVECTPELSLLNLRPDGSVQLRDEMTETEVRLGHGLVGFSLNTLLEIGLETQPKERARLFLSYLRLPLYSDMCPVHIVWVNGMLMYRSLLSHDDNHSIVSTDDDDEKKYNSQATLQVLVDELESEPFSFFEYYSSNGHILQEVGQKFPNSTLVALVHDDREKAGRLYRQMQESKLDNIAVTNLRLNERFSGKLLKSPDFLRYQLIGYDGFLHMLTSLGSRRQFDLMMGQTLASGVTTFVQLPSDQMMSVAMTTFFPWAYSGMPFPGLNIFKQVYGLSEHPFPVYHHTEKRLIGESAKADANINITTTIIPPLPLPNGGQLPWKLVRVDVQNLTVEVDHHFDYELDGHLRKYTLHCVTHNSSNFEVWLVRQKDGYRIPYGQLHVVTLIALLRMGLLEEIKSRLYDKFLQLPLYEDMAPWNIVFDAGKLAYIDYDSKDFTFNKIAPAAFQVIFMLLNYERTVQDFGHCKSNAKVAYGINIVGKCVGSNFRGPCEDTRYPVPCGDHTCRANYMECLQALQHLEQRRANRQDTALGQLRKGHPPGQPTGSPFDSGHWSFGLHGVEARKGGRRDVHTKDDYSDQS